ncbi:MAG: class IV adenylate cyclase [Sedimentisphaerales bacterium]|nr:class IV adenylate cyclase [Sedimentisphaerales bacterium]
MYTEIEAKLKVESLKEVEDRLRGLGAEFAGEQLQEDILFDDAAGTMANNDSCLRLRKQVMSGGTKYILSYKGAKEKSCFKKRREIEIEVNSGDSAKELLSALGYEKKLTVEKKRSLWRFKGCEVALDQLKLLGDFIEIEGFDEKVIDDVQKCLGLESIRHIPKSYASLIAEKIREDEK